MDDETKLLTLVAEVDDLPAVCLMCGLAHRDEGFGCLRCHNADSDEYCRRRDAWGDGVRRFDIPYVAPEVSPPGPPPGEAVAPAATICSAHQTPVAGCQACACAVPSLTVGAQCGRCLRPRWEGGPLTSGTCTGDDSPGCDRYVAHRLEADLAAARDRIAALEGKRRLMADTVLLAARKSNEADAEVARLRGRWSASRWTWTGVALPWVSPYEFCTADGCDYFRKGQDADDEPTPPPATPPKGQP